MKMFLNHRIALLSSLSVCIVMVAMSCNSDKSDTEIGCKNLVVDVCMSSDNWLTSGTVSQTKSDTVDIDDKLVLIVENSPQAYAETPLTRGTPISSANELGSIGIDVFVNNGTTAQSVTGNNNNNVWTLTPAIPISSSYSYDYYTYSPAATASNGISVLSSEKKLKYAAPADVINHPDLCYAAPVLKDNYGKVSFDMKHALTAIGIMVSADSVEIKSITFKQVNTDGTMSLTDGTWTELKTVKDVAPKLTTTKPSTNAAMNNITTTNGYLMLPPQPLTADNKVLEIVYRYAGKTAYTTSTHSLKTLGGVWEAGKKVIYKIQLKAKFTLVLPVESGNIYDVTVQTGASFAYTTNSPNMSEPTATANEPWISAITNTRNGESGTIQFKYLPNTSSQSRSAIITVTSGFTTKKYTVTQLKNIEISLSSMGGTGIPSSGKTYPINVIAPAGITWKATSTTSGCTITPATGTGTVNNVQIMVPKNPTTSARTVDVKFETTIAGAPNKTVTWTASQALSLVSVQIGTTKWLTSNLTGTPGFNNGYKLAPNAQDHGNMFKWGQRRVYARATSNRDGTWSGYLDGASVDPVTSTTGSTGYDYVGLVGELPGDPCAQLGSYRTPTRAQFDELSNAAHKALTYNGTNGIFFGPNAAKCTATSIAAGCIFISASGYRNYNNGGLVDNSELNYWSATVNNKNQCFSLFGVYPENEIRIYVNARGSGFSVRCVEAP